MTPLILVVDDEPDIESLFRQQFRRDLKSGRIGLAFADTAVRALEIIAEARGRDILLLLSDINMPGMSGLELLSRVKSVHRDLPVIMVTAYGDPDTLRRALEGGADGLIHKPIDFAALRAEVDQRLAHGRERG
ncbi:MAG TPA: response regulator [Acetobacteraceae bacterium]|nr:response regulator [Acetobacteraceae bacterium]